MRFVRSVLRGLFDWRTGLTFLASLIVALVLAVVITGARTTNDALDARNRTADTAARRIDRLNDRLDELGARLVVAGEANGQRTGELRSEIAALQEQVRQLGGRPVVAVTTTTVGRSTTSTTSSMRPTTTTVAPPPQPTSCRVSLLGLCLIGG